MSDLSQLLNDIAKAMLERGWQLVTAESCTGGLLAGACTEQAGSSDWFERGFVTYSNEAKVEALGVPLGLLQLHGAVSREVAESMAAGALGYSKAQISIAVTGVAGPGGGSEAKPVGTVWFALATSAGELVSADMKFDGERWDVRHQAVEYALNLLKKQLLGEEK